MPGSPSLSPTSVIKMLVRACTTAYWGKHLDIAPPVKTRRPGRAYPSVRSLRGRGIEGRVCRFARRTASGRGNLSTRLRFVAGWHWLRIAEQVIL